MKFPISRVLHNIENSSDEFILLLQILLSKLMVSHASVNQIAPGSPAKASSDTVTAVHKAIKDVERRRCMPLFLG